MKIRNIMFVAAALLAVACTKNDFYNESDSSSKESLQARVISASFEASDTKTTLDGSTPKWAVDDQIMVSDGTNTQTITLATSGEASTTVGIIKDGGAKFDFKVDGTWGVDLYAVYPAASAQSTMVTNGNVNIKIPNTNSVSSGSSNFAAANICVAKSLDGATLQFKNATSIVNIAPGSGSVQNDYMYFEVTTSSGKAPIAGDFTVTFDGTTKETQSISTAATSGGTTYTSIEGDIKDQSHSYYAIAPVASTSGCTLKVRQNGKTNVFATRSLSNPASFAINKIYNFTHTFIASDYLKEISGEFTVDASGTKVKFSPGNLQAVYNSSSKSYTWRFAENQYDYIGNKAGNTTIGTTQSNGAVVDLFGWSTSATNYGINKSTSSSYYSGKFKDWGETMGSGWCTLSGGSGGEWEWLLGPQTSPSPGENCRTSSTINGTSNARYAEVKVNKKCGMLIFPDVFTWNTSTMGDAPTTFNAKESSWNSVNYSTDQFAAIEAAGGVFLPTAGYRNGSSVYAPGSYGYYWSSTPTNASDASYVYLSYFTSDNVRPADDYDRYYGLSVRLVQKF